MKDLQLNDLPNYTPWVARLLGIEPFNPPRRSIDKVDSEYDKDKYFKCLEYYRQSDGHASIEDVKQFEFGAPGDELVCCSEGEGLGLIRLADARDRYYRLLADSMRDELEAVDLVVELGCGYGFNLRMLSLLYPGKRFTGGEYSGNAVKLAAELFRNQPQLRVEQFNFYANEYELVKRLDRPAVFFTSHAIEQLPAARDIIPRLAASKMVKTVFHFEPAYELHSPSTLLGMLRRRYAEVNDYNRDLMSSLRSSPVRILKCEADVFGLNPLNPTSVISWQPA